MGSSKTTLINNHHYCSLSLWDNQSLPIMGSVVLPHLVTGWHVDQAIVCSRLQISPLHPKTNLEYRCQKRTASLSSASDVTGTQTACVRMKFSTVRSPRYRNPPSFPPQGPCLQFFSHHNTHIVLNTNPRPISSSKKESPTESKTLQFSTYAISIKCPTSSKCTNSTTR